MLLKNTKRNISPKGLLTLAEILKTISHPIRLEVLELLEERSPQSVAEILLQIDVEQSLLSHHLTKMKDRGILNAAREGRNIYYELEFKEITKIFNCMEGCNLI